MWTHLQEHVKSLKHVQTKCKMDHDLYFTRAEAARLSNEETTVTTIHSKKWLRVSSEYSSNAVVSSLCYTGLATYYTQ